MVGILASHIRCHDDATLRLKVTAFVVFIDLANLPRSRSAVDPLTFAVYVCTAFERPPEARALVLDSRTRFSHFRVSHMSCFKTRISVGLAEEWSDQVEPVR